MILEMVNWSDAMEQEVVAGPAEPTCASQITVGGEVAVCADRQRSIGSGLVERQCKFPSWHAAFSPPGDCEIQAA